MNTDTIRTAMKDLEEEVLKEQMRSAAEGGREDALQALEACRLGMEDVGKLFEDGEYFLGDLIYAGEILNDSIGIIKPVLGAGAARGGKVALCTVRGDIHDIGKNIVHSLMEADGLEVHDLGADVPPETIIQEVRDNGISVLALSGVLTLSLESMKETVDALRAAGLRDRVKVVIGGAPVNEAAFLRTGADAWTSSPQKTVEICRGWLT